VNEAAPWLLKKLYQPEVYYQKAGVMLSELVPQGGQQTDRFAYSSSSNKAGRALMDKVDQINKKYRRSTIHLASEGLDRTWSMRHSFKSPNYTGDWDELPAVR
jgi:DNA polymerase V